DVAAHQLLVGDRVGHPGAGCYHRRDELPSGGPSAKLAAAMTLRPASAIALALALVPMSARAQSSPDDLVCAHFQSGSAFYELGGYRDAALACMESSRLSPRPELLEIVARAYERALMFDEAIAALE